MTEHRRQTVGSDRNPDSEIERPYPEASGQTVGVISGNLFTRNLSICTLSGKTRALPTERQVKVAEVHDDPSGDIFFEPYLPSLHGEECDLAGIGLDKYMDDPAYSEQKPDVRKTLKAGASRRVYDSEKKWRENGGDPDFKLPKQVYHPNKLR